MRKRQTKKEKTSQTRLVPIYLLLGSNMGDSAKMLQAACDKIELEIGKITRKSSLYKTAAWGNEDQAPFLNQVIIVPSALSATDCLQAILKIEELLGRKRSVKNAARTIDIDILFYGNAVISLPSLTVPHPELQNRNFVLAPLRELSPNLLHPKYKINMKQLHLRTSDKLAVEKLSSQKQQ